MILVMMTSPRKVNTCTSFIAMVLLILSLDVHYFTKSITEMAEISFVLRPN